MNNGLNGNEKCEVAEKDKCLYNINGWCNRYNIECKLPKISFLNKLLNLFCKK